MKSEFLTAFNQICAERNLPREVVLEAIKTALVSAYRRNADVPATQNVTAEIDPATGEVHIFVERRVVAQAVDPQTEIALDKALKIAPDVAEGDMVMVENTPRDFGRIAAQTARQVILQRIREAERDAQFSHFAEQEGELVYGTVQSVNPQFVTLHLGRTEAILPRKEQVPGERYVLHDRIRAYVMEVRKTSRGPQIIVSRSHKKMLRRLLELEVPEITNGIVEIKSIAREAGSRSKVAVLARQPGVDAVGACVGMRGIRIQSIVKELGGEKVDIIEWSDDPVAFIAKSLSPARVLSVIVDDDPVEGKSANVVVPDDQLSLAIGRAGQNARLAAKLTGWRIDIQGVTEAAEWALQKVKEDSNLQAALGSVGERLPEVAAILRRFETEHYPYTLEELALMRSVIEAVRIYYISLRRSGQAQLAAQEAARRAALAEERMAREAAIQEARQRIPLAAYGLSLDTLKLTDRVASHLERSGIENVGQLLERLAEGDEGLLRLEGIGPKSLTEIRAALDQLDLAPAAAVAPEAPAVEEALVEEAPAVVLPETAEIFEPAPVAEPLAIGEEALPSAVEAAAEAVPLEMAAVPAERVAEVEMPSPAAVSAEPEVTEPLTIPAIDEALWEEVLEEEEEEPIPTKKKPKGRKKARRALILDEDLGQVVVVRRHRRGIVEDWEEE
jgi:N utilization substance protein A